MQSTTMREEEGCGLHMHNKEDKDDTIAQDGKSASVVAIADMDGVWDFDGARARPQGKGQVRDSNSFPLVNLGE